MQSLEAPNCNLLKLKKALLFSCLLFISPLAAAGEYTDRLSECLVSATSEEDELDLVKWMFTAMALHPAVAELAEISLSTREQTNREMAELLIELLSARCSQETRLAVRHEGSLALETSFSVLGQVAATNLFSNPNVAQGLASLETYISAEDLNRPLVIGQ